MSNTILFFCNGATQIWCLTFFPFEIKMLIVKLENFNPINLTTPPPPPQRQLPKCINVVHSVQFYGDCELIKYVASLILHNKNNQYISFCRFIYNNSIKIYKSSKYFFMFRFIYFFILLLIVFKSYPFLINLLILHCQLPVIRCRVHSYHIPTQRWIRYGTLARLIKRSLYCVWPWASLHFWSAVWLFISFCSWSLYLGTNLHFDYARWDICFMFQPCFIHYTLNTFTHTLKSYVIVPHFLQRPALRCSTSPLQNR